MSTPQDSRVEEQIWADPHKAGASNRPRGRSTTLQMPSELQPGRDMSLLAIMMAVGFLLAACWYDVIPMFIDTAAWRGARATTALRLPYEWGMVILSVTIWWVNRKRSITPRRATQLAALLQVSACLVIAIPLGPVPAGVESARNHGISWVCVLIVIYPLMIPGTARYHMGIALACASFWPLYQLGLLLGRGSAAMHHLGFILDYSVPPYLCVGIVMVMARVMGQMREAVERAAQEAVAARRLAREMGCYSLRKRLGRGGMGEVWQAEHRMLARPAAIKLIHLDQVKTGSTTEEMLLQRFEQEARATAHLRSQHTVELYDYGRTEEGAFYYVMEMLDGVDLEDLVTRYGAQPPARVIHILAQACLSLEEAHRQQFIHRDIKPSNIFLCRQGTELDVVKVLDFGLVQHGVEGTGNKTRYLMGTPAYMAPESMTAHQPIDHRSDLYSLGCVAYRLLTGEPVFKADRVEDFTEAHLHRAPPALVIRNGDPDPKLEALVMSCLSKDPNQRPASASALREQLQHCARHYPWDDASRHRWWSQFETDPQPTPPSSPGQATVTLAVASQLTR